MAMQMAKWIEYHSIRELILATADTEVAHDLALHEIDRIKNDDIIAGQKLIGPSDIKIIRLSRVDNNHYIYFVSWTWLSIMQYDIDVRRFHGNDINVELCRLANEDLKKKKERSRTMYDYKISFPICN